MSPTKEKLSATILRSEINESFCHTRRARRRQQHLGGPCAAQGCAPATNRRGAALCERGVHPPQWHLRRAKRSADSKGASQLSPLWRLERRPDETSQRAVSLWP